jgi:hypothetical protein
MTTLEDQEADACEFDAFDVIDDSMGRVGAMLAHCYQAYGPEVVRQIVLKLIADGTERRFLDKTVKELQMMELPDIADLVMECAATIPEPVCPYEAGTGDFRAWHMKRAKEPFDSKVEAEECLLNLRYRETEPDYWLGLFGQDEAKVLKSKCGQGFRILRLKAGADWQKYLTEED